MKMSVELRVSAHASPKLRKIVFRAGTLVMGILRDIAAVERSLGYLDILVSANPPNCHSSKSAMTCRATPSKSANAKEHTTTSAVAR